MTSLDPAAPAPDDATPTGVAPSRRAVLAGGAALAAVGYVSSPPPAFAGERELARRRSVRVTVLGTTDLHGNVYNWDYFKNREFDNSGSSTTPPTTTSAWPRSPP
jgi:2',3'-cyclic-nucleotide 2'-phosphodiesterase/3'-nucleotidase